MKIGVDISDLSADRADGTTRYTAELAKRLPEAGREHEWVFLAPFDSPVIRQLAQRNPRVRIQLSPWPNGWTQLRLPRELYRERLDVLFMPIQQLPALRPRRLKTVAVVHDLAVHCFPEQFTRKDWLLLHIFSAQAAREADVLIAVSQATADDVARYYGRSESVHVVHHGVDHDRFALRSNSEREATRQMLLRAYPALMQPYILYVGQIQPRKNLIRLVEAFEEVILRRPPLNLPLRKGEKLQLVMAGGHGWLQQPILHRIRSSSLRQQINLLGRVPEELLPALYREAATLVLPSLYEGFGMPLLEAFASGCPVVAANVSSLPEVANGAAVLVDPTDSTDIACGLGTVLEAPAVWRKKGSERAQQFSWERCARETLRAIERAVL